MTNYSFEDIQDSGVRVNRVRTAGIHENGKFKSLEYVLAPDGSWEAFNIEVEDNAGAILSERTFGPNIDRIFPKRKYENNAVVGEETKEEAFNRIQKEISKKLFYLAVCFVDEKDLREEVKSASDLKSLVEKVASLIEKSGNKNNSINFLTVWKNNDNKKTSKMIFPENSKWVESTRLDPEGKVVPSIIQLTPYQRTQQSFEKYPFVGSTTQQVNESFGVDTSASDLPF